MRCYLCGNEQLESRPGKVRDNASLGVLECQSCGLVMLSSMSHIRDGHYEESGMFGGALPSIEAIRRGADGDDQRRFEMLRHFLVNRRVLDFGCGSGGFVAKVQTLAESCVGVEPERRMRDQSTSGTPIYESSRSK